VSLGHLAYPAADLSEQISTAGKEASGTGNMKFALNGALTIGTPMEPTSRSAKQWELRTSSSWPECRGSVGVEGQRIQPVRLLQHERELRQVIDSMRQATSRLLTDLFKPIVESLLHRDEYLHLADQSYVDCQEQVATAYRDQENWTRMSILNVARMGKFSSDRTIQEYCRKSGKLSQSRLNRKCTSKKLLV